MQRLPRYRFPRIISGPFKGHVKCARGDFSNEFNLQQIQKKNTNKYKKTLNMLKKNKRGNLTMVRNYKMMFVTRKMAENFVQL